MEPRRRFGDLSPERLQENLKAFIKSCARKTGIEKALWVRRGIETVRYSKKSIGVDFVLSGASGANSERGASVRGGDSRPFSDGKSQAGFDLSASARSAANGANLTDLAGDSRGDLTAGTEADSQPGNKKEPNRSARLDPSFQFDTTRNGGFFEIPTTVVPLTFPNIAHHFWENYRLTGEYHIRPSKLGTE